MIQTETLKETVHRVLRHVSRPARYVGGELNVIRKSPSMQNISVCLAFPDIYDIGQSYIGFHILYHILNKRPSTLCERTFAPWIDMEEMMRERGIPLWSLENYLPVSSFDVVGFTLQYELHYSTVLNMLHLAGIPIKSSDRGEDSPLIFGGGTCCTNPEPVADFFDAFLLGDGEEAFPEMLDVVERCKKEKVSRHETLERLTSVQGVYVPSLYAPRITKDGSFIGIEPLTEKALVPVTSRIVEEMKPEYYSDRPLVPLCEVVHDRLAVEIMRGCTRGCRFCEAGTTYRPQRVRPVSDVVSHVVNGIKASGWDEVSLVSLSTSDYPGLESVVEQIGKQLEGKAVSISLSSLRADNFSLKMAEATAGGRKTGLTFAVEAGTQRLRDVINKNLTEQQLFDTMQAALTQGFGNIKLYFMIGLPTETDSDVAAIAGLLDRLGAMQRRLKGRPINVTVSPFAPKPMTPFQWDAQDSLEALKRKQKLIRRHLKSRSVRIKDSNPLPSIIECRLARGGRDLGAIVFEAWKRGSRLDGWSEHFDETIWLGVFRDTGIDLEDGGEAIEPGAPLPWGHFHFGVDEHYLLAEREKAYRGETTSDCRETCHACGPYAPLCDALKNTAADSKAPENVLMPPSVPGGLYGRKKKTRNGMRTPLDKHGTHIRIKYGKNGTSMFTSHLDLVRIFDRSLRRASIPIAYSQGFHPHPRLSFGHPLPLGLKSTAEYVDIILSEPFPGIDTSLQQGLPDGLDLIEIRSIPEKTKSLTSFVTLAEYFVRCEADKTVERIIRDVLERDNIVITRMTKRGARTIDVRRGIKDIRIAEDRSGFTMLLSFETDGSVKPSEVLALVFPEEIPDDITRTEQYTEHNGEMVTPLDVLW